MRTGEAASASKTSDSTVTAVEPGPDGVALTVGSRQVHADDVIAADGGRTVANALGIPMVGQPRGLMLDGILRKWFWGSRIGGWVGKQLSRLSIYRARPSDHPGHR